MRWIKKRFRLNEDEIFARTGPTRQQLWTVLWCDAVNTRKEKAGCRYAGRGTVCDGRVCSDHENEIR